MEERQRLEIGERITLLRERSPYTQPEVADKLGIGLRAYQKLEKTGTTQYERCQEIVTIHADWVATDPDWAHVSAGWLWDGRERDRNADLMGALSAESPETELAAAVSELTRQVAALRTELTAELGKVQKAQAAQQKQLEHVARTGAKASK